MAEHGGPPLNGLGDGGDPPSEHLRLRFHSTRVWFDTLCLAGGAGFIFMFLRESVSSLWVIVIYAVPIITVPLCGYLLLYVAIRGDTLTLKEALFKKKRVVPLSDVVGHEFADLYVVLKCSGQESIFINLGMLKKPDREPLVRALKSRLGVQEEG